jgi:adenylosuccinate synthase
MATKKLFSVADLGGGEGGKGSVKHKICCELNAHSVLKVGGAQGSHGVRTSMGQNFNFSQFGCGTFEGVNTHITDLMIVEPYGFMYEGKCLQYEFGIREVFDMVTVDENALCITPFHTFESQLQELSRKDNPKGTVGLGAGVAVMDSEIYPDLAIHVKDLNDSNLKIKLARIQEQKIANLKSYLNNVSDLWPKDQKIAKEILEKLNDLSLVDRVAFEFQKMGKAVKIVDRSYLKKLLSQDHTLVVESSHGVLTDRYYGFHPNVSRLRTMPNLIWDLIEELGYNGEMFKLGVSRAYAIRHGAGPMVTEDKKFTRELFQESHKGDNRWQGKVRAGPLDFVALRYAINCCGGKDMFDGLAITWFDQILHSGKWEICNRYENATNPELFTKEGEIKVRHEVNEEKLKHQEKLNKALRMCKPITELHNFGKDAESLINLCKTEILEKLGVPVRMISVGSTEDKKILI